MNRSNVQFWVSLILLATMFISSLPSYPAFAGAHNSRREEQDKEEELIVTLQNEVPLDAFPPEEPLIFIFSEPMQIDSSSAPVITAPFVHGQITWSEDAKQLTFNPEGGFALNQIYTITLDMELVSVSGKRFGEPPSWVIHTLGGPLMTSRSPDSLTISDRFPIIRLTFDQRMDPESVINAISVEPEIEMDFGWGGHDFFLRSLTELVPNREYRFSINQEAKDIHGIPLRTAYRWSYSLEPVIKEVTHPTQDNRQTYISLEFNYGVQWDSLKGNLSIEPETPGHWMKAEANLNRIFFIPDEQLKSDFQYTIRFQGTLYDLRGSELPTPEPIYFRTPPAIWRTDPSGDEIEGLPSDFILSFDRAMDEAVTGAALSFDPPIQGHYSWEFIEFEEDENPYGDSLENIEEPLVADHSLFFIPDPGSIAWDTEYTVTLDVTAIDAKGNPILQEPFQWSFQTGVPEDAYHGRFGYDGANIQIIDNDGPRAIQYEYSGGDETNIDFSLHALTLNQFLARYPLNPIRDYWKETSNIDLEGIPQIRRWTEQIPEIREGIGEVRIPYDIPAGIFVLNLHDANFDFVVDQIFVVLSKNTLVVKQAPGQIVTWVSDINGEPNAGVRVQIYDEKGQFIDSGTSDEIGVYRSSFSRQDIPYLVVAQDGNDISVSGLDRSWQERESIWSWMRSREPEPVDYGINTYTDRPIYRPGQTVFFKAIVRQDNDAILSLPPQGTPVAVRVRDPRNNVVQSYDLSTNSFGSIHEEFKLSEGAMVGDYTIEVEALGKNIQQIFKVQDYKKPDIQALLETDADQYVDGDEIQLTIRADYLFGEPVSDASVSLTTYDLVPASWWYWGDKDEDQYYWSNGGSVHEDRLKMENGLLSYSIRAEIDDYGSREYYSNNIICRTFALEAEIYDGSGQSISTYKILKVYSSSTKLTLDMGDYYKTPGQTFSVDASAFSLTDDPFVEYPLQLTVKRYNRETGEYDEVILDINLTTGENGKVSHEMSLEETGAYRFEISATDDRGNQTSCQRWVYIYEKDDAWVSDFDNEIRILAAKTTYSPGEIANLVIESSFDGEALLTVQRGTTRRVKSIFLTAPTTNVDLELLETDSPNIFVSIHAYMDQKSSMQELPNWEEYWHMESLVECQLHQDTIELTVPPRNKELVITITPDKEIFKPREEANFSILVTDMEGNPVSAELSLAMVDEAIFSLSEDLSGSLYDAFYAPRKNGVQTYDSMGARRWIYMYQGGGGGGGPDLPGTPRSDFPDTAAWIPVLHTDTSGKAEITITLPDTLTTWRMTAKAVTKDTKVGETEIKLLTKQEVVIRPLIPRNLTEGDEVILSANVQNYTDHEREFSVLLMNTFFEVLDPALQSVSLKPDEEGKVSWRVRAYQPGEASITMIADDGDVGDAVQVTIPVQQISIPELTTQAGEFQGHLSTTIHIPEENLSESRVEINLNRSITDSLLDGLNYLTDFPYGCVEQTMSRALPNAMVARAYYQLGIGTLPEITDLHEKINSGLQRLYGYQHIDGGWGWWHDDDSREYETAWVVYGLTMTAEAGYEVEPEVIRRGAGWLSNNLDEMDDRIKAYALYSMAVSGYGELDETLDLITKIDNLDAFSIAALALTLHELEEPALALSLIKRLERLAVVNEKYVFWPVLNADQNSSRQTMSSKTRDTALALSAFVTIAPNHPYETRIVRWLMGQRTANGWGDTHQTSYAILALTDYLLSSSQSSQTTSYAVSLNGEEIATGSLGPQAPDAKIEISGEQLLPGENSLEITQQGAGQMYYTISSWTYKAEQEVDAAGDIIIERRYLSNSTDRPISTGEVGELVKVELKVTMPTYGSFIILEDKLPGGFEALNESLSVTSHELTIFAEPRFAWEYNGYNHKEIRPDRVSFFFTELEEGTHIITYLVRVKHPGDFTVMPVQVWAMYDNTHWGRSSSTSVTVED